MGMFKLAWCTIFLWSDAAAPIYFSARFCAATIQGRLLFEGGVYFFGKPADTNDSWIRYEQTIQWQLLDAFSSKNSLSILLSAVGMSRTTRTVLAPARWPLSKIICTRVHVSPITAAATIWGWRLFCSELLIVWLLFEGGIYSKKYVNWQIFWTNRQLLLVIQPTTCSMPCMYDIHPPLPFAAVLSPCVSTLNCTLSVLQGTKNSAEPGNSAMCYVPACTHRRALQKCVNL